MKKTILRITDQVNCKFIDLDPFTKRKVVESLKFFVPYARHMPAFKLGRWDGKVGFATVGGSTYVNLLDRALPVVLGEGYEVEIEDLRPTFDFEFPEVSEQMFSHKVWPEGHPIAGQPIQLRDYQAGAIKTYLENLQSIQSISTGAGKAQPLWAKIKIPNGWTTMGEIAPGDFVSTPDGGSAKVLGVYPQGAKEYYRITFKDGRTAEACGDHLWDVYNLSWKSAISPNGVRTCDTNMIKHRLDRFSEKLYINLIKPQQEDAEVSLPIDPYVLGVLLGDGCIKTKIEFASNDDEIVTKMAERLPVGYKVVKATNQYGYRIVGEDKVDRAEKPKGTIFNTVKIALTELGLMGLGSHDKFVPDLYLSASSQQRREILRGLLDTDGTAKLKGGTVSFTTMSPQLATGVVELARSLGGIAKISKQTNGSLVVNIRHPDRASLFHLTRKKQRIGDTTSQIKLEIVSVERVGITDCQCILIDHTDHLYVTDNYVVTHNTLLTASMSSIIEPYGRSMIIVPSKSLVEQTEEDYVNLGLDVGVWYGDRKEWGKKHTIATWQSLTVFTKKERRGELDDLGISFADFVEDVVCVMVDETHSAKANELKDLLCGPMGHIPIRWGLTGTVPKEEHEYLSIVASLGPVVGEIKASDLQDQGVLANCHVDVLQLRDEVEYNTYHEEYNYLVTDQRRMAWIGDYVVASAEKLGNTLILVDRIESGEFLNDYIEGATFISGDVKTKDRKREYKAVHHAQGKVIIATYGVAAVGINVPRIFNLILLEAGKSPVRVIQSIGRGIRKAHDKDFVQITDLCSTAKFSGRHVPKRRTMYKEANYPYTTRKIDFTTVPAIQALEQLKKK